MTNPSPIVKPRSSERPLLSLLSFFFRKYRLSIFIGTLAIITVDMAEIALPLLLKRIIDAVTAGNERELVGSTLIGLSCIVGIQVVCRYVWRVSLSRSSMMAGADLRERFSNQIFCVPVSLYDRKKVGELMTLATSDVENIRLALGPGVIATIDAIFYCLTLPAAMYFLAPQLALKMLVPVIGIPIAVLVLQKKISLLSSRVQARLGVLGTETQDMIAGVRLGKIFGVERRMEGILNGQSHELNQSQIRLARLQASVAPSLEFFLSVSLVTLFGMGSGVSVGTLVAMQRYLQKLMWPMSAVGMAIVHFQKAKASGREFFQFLEEPKVEQVDTVPAFAGNQEIKTSEPLIEARNLSFSYQPGKISVIENLSFQLYPGEWLGIEGNVASGKSTLLFLLLKFYEVPRGHLFVLGKDVVDWNAQEIRTLFSSVLQDPYLFQGSIRYNLDVGEEIEFESALNSAEIGTHILEHRLDEVLGEKGSGLSGGQKQRIGIARALRKNAPIFLLDDPLSSVDIQTSQSVLNNLTRELRVRKKTVLFVSHHPEHLEYCDRTIRIDRGAPC